MVGSLVSGAACVPQQPDACRAKSGARDTQHPAPRPPWSHQPAPATMRVVRLFSVDGVVLAGEADLGDGHAEAPREPRVVAAVEQCLVDEQGAGVGFGLPPCRARQSNHDVRLNRFEAAAPGASRACRRASRLHRAFRWPLAGPMAARALGPNIQSRLAAKYTTVATIEPAAATGSMRDLSPTNHPRTSAGSH